MGAEGQKGHRQDQGPRSRSEVKLRPRVKDRMSGLYKLCFLWLAFFLGFSLTLQPHTVRGEERESEEPRMFATNERRVFHCPYATDTWHWVGAQP